jgi:hypothetical protein
MPVFIHTQMGFFPQLRGKYASARDFLDNYDPPASTLADFITFAGAQDTTLDMQQLRQSLPQLRSLLRTFMAGYLFEPQELIEALNQDDPFVQKGLEVLEVDNPLEHLSEFVQ